MSTGVTAPLGFRAAAVASGIKPDRLDLALLVADTPCTAAGVFTANLAQAAPVLVSREHLASGRARAIVVNAGCANAGTGEGGLKDARETAEIVAHTIGCTVEEVLVASTGVIGVRLAAQTESVAQGESYYFQTDDKNIITGMNVSAWIPDQNAKLTGVIIPQSALIWYMGQALVYLKTAEETFSRSTINHYSATADGYFISDAIEPGEQIVTKGAQMLLSEELRGQIPSENDD